MWWRFFSAAVCVAFAACTCDGLDLEQKQFACSRDTDCSAEQSCVRGFCAPNGLHDAGSGGSGGNGGGQGGGATGGGAMGGGAMGGGMGGGAMGGGVTGGGTGGGASDAGANYDIPNGTLFFTESFEDNMWTEADGGGWYDSPQGSIVAAPAPGGGASSFRCDYNVGSGICTGGRPSRHLLPPTETFYLRVWVRFSSNWVGGVNQFNPVIFSVLTDADNLYIGPGSTTLTVEPNFADNSVVMALHDNRNVNMSCLIFPDGGFTGCGGDPATYNFTEARSVATCNGVQGSAGENDCVDNGDGTALSYRAWRSAPWFTDTAGPRYKGDWHHYELYLQMNTVAAGIGQPDGKMRVWLDGERVVTFDQILFRTGAHPTLKFNQFIVLAYQGGTGSPVAQSYWLDELTIASGKVP